LVLHGAVPTTLDWYGCATFRLRTAGLTIFLDAYIDRVPSAPGTGLTADDVDECDWIVIGHSHFDHVWGAERIVANTDARVIASYETVRVLEHAGVPVERMLCVGGGERVDLGNGVHVRAFPSLHSCIWSTTGMAQAGDVCIGDLGLTYQEREARMRELARSLTTALDAAAIAHLLAGAGGHSDRGDGGALVFLFETPDGTLLYQDTSGRWRGVLADLTPDVAILAAAGRGNVDGEPVQGTLAAFVAQEAALTGARRVLLGHHDDWLPGFSTPLDVAPIRAAIAEVAPGCALLEPGYLEATAIFEGLR
jgi:L-ascorbate metabolism protein UlaG (beta-lactamase superfamily)